MATTTSKTPRIVGLITIIAGAIFFVAGAVTWGMVSSNLKAEEITVSEDAAFLGGATVQDPFSAFAQADIINHHALDGAGGKTYAELGALAREANEAGDTAAAEEYTAQRTTAMNASFLRASLFTSVVSYGIAALVIGLGLLFAIIGWALTTIKYPSAKSATVTE
jgi:hypothetical protein